MGRAASDVGVVLVAHRVHEWLERAIASVADEAREVIVVDNGSAGGGAGEIARSAGARVVRIEENLGFPGGVNAGVAALDSPVVALLNDDAWAAPGWLRSASRVLADPAVGAITPKLLLATPYAVVRFPEAGEHRGGDHRRLGRRLGSVLVGGREVLEQVLGPGIHAVERAGGDLWRWTTGPEPLYVPLVDGASPTDVVVDGERPPLEGTTTLVNSAGTYLSAHGYGGDYGYGAPDDGRFDAAAERFGACGAAVVFRREVFDRIGPFASHFFAYYEDLDWSWRLRLAGLGVRYDPTGVVHHVGGVTSGGPVASGVVHLAARNRLACLTRNAPARVVRQEISRAWRHDLDRTARRGVPGALARALVDRVRLRRHASVSRDEVWRRWAGVDETW